MQCRRCGKEIGDAPTCRFCGYENQSGNVREMTSIEKNFYDGVTIDTGESENTNSGYYSQNNNYNYTRRIFYTSTSSSSGIFSRLLGRLFTGLINNELLAKIAVTLIAFALGALMFFVALPILFIVLAVGIALFILSKLGR